MAEPRPRGLNRRDFIKFGALSTAATLLAGCPQTPKTPKPSVTDLGNGTYLLPSGNIVNGKGDLIYDASASSQEPGDTQLKQIDKVNPEPTPQPTVPQEADSSEKDTVKESNKDLPDFAISGVDSEIKLNRADDRLSNNGPDAEGIDHITTHLPASAGAVVADPGCYRTDDITNVTDPAIRATIERDVRNGAAYAGDNYKKEFTDSPNDVPLMESGGSAMITTDHGQVAFKDANGNLVTIQFGSKPNNAYVVVVQNGLKRDNVRDTDANRTMNVSRYDTAWTMWQGIPPGRFVSDMFVSQTVADAHGSYRDRGTSSGAGHDGHTLVTLIIAKILAKGVVYGVYEHDNLGKWEDYTPGNFKQIAGNLVIQ